MLVKGYEVIVDIDGDEKIIEIDDLYPAIYDWKSASDFAMMMAHEFNPKANQIDFVECTEYEMAEYRKYPYIFPAPFAVQ
jgi:hypothetical protein